MVPTKAGLSLSMVVIELLLKKEVLYHLLPLKFPIRGATNRDTMHSVYTTMTYTVCLFVRFLFEFIAFLLKVCFTVKKISPKSFKERFNYLSEVSFCACAPCVIVCASAAHDFYLYKSVIFDDFR